MRTVTARTKPKEPQGADETSVAFGSIAQEDEGKTSVLREVQPKVVRFTLEVTEPFNELLEQLATDRGTSKKEVLLNAVKLYHWLLNIPGRELADFAVVDAQGKVQQRLYLNL